MPDYAYDSCAGMWMKRMSDPDSSKLHMNVYGIVRDPTAVSKTRRERLEDDVENLRRVDDDGGGVVWE